MLGAALAGLFTLPVISSGQLIFERAFDVEGIINPGNENVTGVLSSTVTVKFLETNDTEFDFVDTIEVTVANTSTTDSQIAEFFLLNPVLGLAPTSVTPGDWTLQTELSSTLAQYGGLNPNDPNIGEYFGASYPPPTGILSGASEVFSFGFQAFAFDSDAWMDSFGYEGLPNVFIRWQSVSIDGGSATNSGKGFYDGGGYDPGVDPSVPEPSAIAAMAVLGMGGLLYVRRRLTRKK